MVSQTNVIRLFTYRMISNITAETLQKAVFAKMSHKPTVSTVTGRRLKWSDREGFTTNVNILAMLVGFL